MFARLPAELRLQISGYNFDAMAWFMLTDPSIYTHYAKHKDTFHELFLEHEASSELVLLLFKKLVKSEFLSLITFQQCEPYLMAGVHLYMYTYKPSDGVWRKYTIEYATGTQRWFMYTDSGGLDGGGSVQHRDILDGKSLAAVIEDGKKLYYLGGWYYSDAEYGDSSGCVIS